MELIGRRLLQVHFGNPNREDDLFEPCYFEKFWNRTLDEFPFRNDPLLDTVYKLWKNDEQNGGMDLEHKSHNIQPSGIVIEVQSWTDPFWRWFQNGKLFFTEWNIINNRQCKDIFGEEDTPDMQLEKLNLLRSKMQALCDTSAKGCSYK